eukprot:scaffold7.g3451.t1
MVELRPLPDYGLPPLPSLPCPDFRGPTPWSNWVIKGRVIAGAYPASLDDAETERLLTTLLELGMNTFVCLQAEFSLHTPESAWRTGQGLRPYIKDAQKLLIRAREERSARIKQARDKLDFLHLPILDGNVTSDSALSRLADDCNQRILRGERLYIHCWGGHGRTGTLVATMLGRLYHVSCSGALRYTQAFHDSRKFPQGVRSPQTSVQVAQVKRLLPDPPQLRGIVYERDPSLVLDDEIVRPPSAPPSPAIIKPASPRRSAAAAAAAAAGAGLRAALIAAVHPPSALLYAEVPAGGQLKEDTAVGTKASPEPPLSWLQRHLPHQFSHRQQHPSGIALVGMDIDGASVATDDDLTRQLERQSLGGPQQQAPGSSVGSKHGGGPTINLFASAASAHVATGTAMPWTAAPQPPAGSRPQPPAAPRARSAD